MKNHVSKKHDPLKTRTTIDLKNKMEVILQETDPLALEVKRKKIRRGRKPDKSTLYKCEVKTKIDESDVLHVCKICQFGGFDKSKMVEHYRIHNYCYNCSMVFEDKPTTADHFKNKHYYLKCERNQCYFVGLNNASMKTHLNEKHPNSNVS